MAVDDVRRHYASQGLYDRILEALAADDKALDRLQPDDLAGIDEFHTRGRAATLDLVRLLDLKPSDRILDLGSGLGGPSRFLARTLDARVTGIDLTPEFCDVATRLSELLGLADKTTFQVADALAIPFADATFDVVWSQNVAMNIADRERLYREVRRVLRPGGRYGFADVTAVAGRQPLYPQPWAAKASMSHLRTPDETRQAITGAGLELRVLEDMSIDALARSKARLASEMKPKAPRLGLALLFADTWPTIQRNSIENYESGAIGHFQGVAVKPIDAAQVDKVV
jgi:SAM-dependent methyltransferase